MTCKDYKRLLSGHVDGVLSARQECTLLQHVEGCPRCATRLAQYRQMDVLLRRLPGTIPSGHVREALRGRPEVAPSDSRTLFGASVLRGALAVALFLAIAAAGVFSVRANAGEQSALVRAPAGATDAQLAQGTISRTDVIPIENVAGRPPTREVVSAGVGAHETVSAADDARVLSQVRGMVVRAGFRPLQPGYLPRGARLSNVDFGRRYPGEPIDRLEIAFAAQGKQLRLRQLSGQALQADEQRLLAQQQGDLPKRVSFGGHEWLYLRYQPAERGAEPSYVLIGRRDGMTIWLESSLPIEELEKVAASLVD